MGPWRLELLRVWRTRSAIALIVTFLVLGLGAPVLAYYLPDIAKGGTGSGVRVIVSKSTPADGIVDFAGNVSDLGTLVVAVVAAASLSIDASAGLAAFYRTRLRRPALLLLPRYAIVTATSVAALALGTLGAWHETAILLGTVSFGALLGGFALEALWLCFVTSIVAAFSCVIRRVPGVIGGAIVLLLALGLLQGLPVVSSWFPTRLAASGADFLHQSTGDIWHAAVVATLSAVVALSLAVNRVGKREL